MDNKLTGSFYTPQKLIEYMAKYISGRITPRSILEPSAGDGRFVPAISIFDCPITAVELYKEKADALHMHCGEKCEIICADFLSYALETEKKYDFIIGNPPYISKKSLPECQRDLSLKLVEHFKLDEALFQNIWVSFILASLKVLSPNGSIFFVLPFEFLQVQYAERLREFLETKFNTIEITTFEDCIFPEIEQDVCFDKYTSLQLGARKKKERKVKEEGQLALAGAKKAVAVFADQINTLKKAVSDTSSTTTPEQQAAHLAEVEAHVSKVFSTAEE